MKTIEYLIGIIVIREYENNSKILDEINRLLPNCYI